MDKPFIKLFHTPNSGYFYDVGKNEIIRIPENVYQHLSEVMERHTPLGQTSDKDLVQMIESFKELGYLSTNRPKKIQHPATTITPLLLDRCIDKIILQLTQDCNFRCKYCIYSEEKNFKQRTHTKRSMSLDTAKKAIMFYRDHAVDSSILHIGLYGGEPLLESELLREVVLFAEKELRGKLLTFSLTTNASLLTEELAAFLEKHHISTLISIDGTPEINDSNRVFLNGKGTSSTVLKNIKMIKENHPALFKDIRISTVIDPDLNERFLGEYPEIINEIPLEHYAVSIAENTDHKVVLPEHLTVELEREAFLAYLAEFHLYSGRIRPYGYKRAQNLHNWHDVIKTTNRIYDVMAPGGPCIPGKTRLFVTTNGDLYPCERVNETEANCIGNLDLGIDAKKAQRILNVGTISAEKCRGCWALRLCSICIKYFDYSKENAEAEKTNLCKSVQANAYERIRLAIMSYEFDEYYRETVKGDKADNEKEKNSNISSIC